MSANDIRVGNVLEHSNRLFVVNKPPEHTKPGKGGAFVQVEMSDIVSGTKIYERFRSTETVTKARLDETNMNFLYQEGEMLLLMNNETFEQQEIPLGHLGDDLPMVQEGMELTLRLHEENIISVSLPDSAVYKIKEADPVIKGQTATASYKPAVLENGVKVMVPPFVSSDDNIVVKIADRSYVERAKDA
ncbi:MAG: elongation factor P [Pseudomonadota bacterium]